MIPRTFAFFLTSLILSVVGCTSCVAAQQVHREKRTVSGEELQKLAIERAKAEATPVQAIQMTAQQQGDSRLYRHYSGGPSVRDLLSSQEGEYICFGRNTGLPGGLPDQPAKSQREAIRELVRSADAVVVGIVQDKTSLLTDTGDFIFTNYSLTPQEILKDNPADPIKKKTALTVSRPGGLIRIDDRVVEAVDEAFPLLQKGSRYVLFLRYIVTTGSYLALGSVATYDLQDGRASALTTESTNIPTMDELYFIGEIRSAVLCGAR